MCVVAGEAYRVAGRRQRPSDERPDAAEGALQHADPQRHLAHQPHQTADHRERRVQEQQQLLGGRTASARVPASECVRVCVCTDIRMRGRRQYVHAWMHAGLKDCEGAHVCFYFKKRKLLEDIIFRTLM